MMSSPRKPRYVLIDVAADTMFRWLSITPLASPVEPDVYTMLARSWSIVGGSRNDGPLWEIAASHATAFRPAISVESLAAMTTVVTLGARLTAPLTAS